MGWGLIHKGAYCAVKKVQWNFKEQTIDECMDHCERNQATISLYRSLNKNCACCKDPPGIIVGAQQINMYQYQGGNLFLIYVLVFLRPLESYFDYPIECKIDYFQYLKICIKPC